MSFIMDAGRFAKQLHSHLLPSTPSPSLSQVRFWFGLSLGFALLYGIVAWKQAFATPYVVQDDARQHVFWMRQFLDPNLFPNDLIVRYFRSVAPIGYTAFYWVAAQLGLDPLIFSKLLPMGLALITTGYCFRLCQQMIPIPVVGFVASLLLNQNLWLKDDLSSATPRAFLYPLLTAFLYYLSRRSLLPCLVTLALQGLFYPQTVLLSSGVLVLMLVQWQDGRLRLTSDRPTYRFCGLGLAVSLLVLLPFALQTSEFDPVITVAAARQLPEFTENGRTAFFISPVEFWLNGERSGLFPRRLVPPLIWTGFLLPFLRFIPLPLPLLERITPDLHLLTRLSLASLGWFFLAHLVLFKLHLPSRYTQHSIRLILAVAAAIVLVVLVDGVVQGLVGGSTHPEQGRSLLAMGLMLVLGSSLLLHPAPARKPDAKPTETAYTTNYQTGTAPELYAFLQTQPKDSLIASLSLEADNLPTLAQRSILVGREYSIPFQRGYYNEMRRRIVDLITAHYSTESAQLRAFIQQYEIDFLLLESGWLRPNYLQENAWLMQFQPATNAAIAHLKQRQPPALQSFRRRCTVWKNDRFTLLDATCIVATPDS